MAACGPKRNRTVNGPFRTYLHTIIPATSRYWPIECWSAAPWPRERRLSAQGISVGPGGGRLPGSRGVSASTLGSAAANKQFHSGTSFCRPSGDAPELAILTTTRAELIIRPSPSACVVDLLNQRPRQPVFVDRLTASRRDRHFASDNRYSRH
jgi:hypothetical protein